MRRYYLVGRAYVQEGEQFLEMNSGNGCPTLPLKCTRKK